MLKLTVEDSVGVGVGGPCDIYEIVCYVKKELVYAI